MVAIRSCWPSQKLGLCGAIPVLTHRVRPMVRPSSSRSPFSAGLPWPSVPVLSTQGIPSLPGWLSGCDPPRRSRVGLGGRNSRGQCISVFWPVGVELGFYDCKRRGGDGSDVTTHTSDHSGRGSSGMRSVLLQKGYEPSSAIDSQLELRKYISAHNGVPHHPLPLQGESGDRRLDFDIVQSRNRHFNFVQGVLVL